MSEIDLHMVVVNYHTYDLLQAFLDSFIEFQPESNTQLTIVDVESTSERYNVDTYDFEVIYLKENWGYAKSCNLASTLVPDARNLAFFNADTRFVDNHCVDYCISYLDGHPEVGVVGPLQYDSARKVTHAGILGTHASPSMNAWMRPVTDGVRKILPAVSVSGSAFFTKMSVWNEMMRCEIFSSQFSDSEGAFPPFPHFYEETLYSYHVAAHGYDVVYLGLAEMIHEWHKSSQIGSQSEKYREGQKGFRMFCDAHGIDHD